MNEYHDAMATLASCFGNLTMEKVIKDENDQHKNGSLVFRIKRTFSESNNDSGIKCSSPSSDEMSNEMPFETCLSPIRVRIPKALLAEAESVLNLSKNGCFSPEDLTVPDKNIDSSVLSNNITLENVESETLNANTTNRIIQDAGKFRKKVHRTVSKFAVPMESRRRSKRIVDLQLQKESQQHSTVDVASKVEGTDTIMLPEGAGCDFPLRTELTTRPCIEENLVAPKIVKRRQKRKAVSKNSSLHVVSNIERQESITVPEDFGCPIRPDLTIPPCTKENPVSTEIVKRRQKRNAVSKTVEPKKRKYARRGRPPKLALENNPEIKEQSWSNSPRSDQTNAENVILQSTNSVWTLVPRSLFRLEFFKSQVLKIRPVQPLEQIRHLTPEYLSPPTFAHPVQSVSNTRIRLKYPRNVEARPRKSEIENSKRPTVIYFRKNFNKFLTNQSAANKHSERNKRTESTKNKDLLYLSSKYRMLDYAVVKNCYELNKCNIIQTDFMLSQFFSSSLDVTSEEIIENTYIKQDTSVNIAVPDIGHTGVVSSHSEKADIPSNALSRIDDADELCCKVIVQSLNILFSEEAVLQ